MVDEGEKLAVYYPAQKGIDGQNIFGEVLHANKGIEKKPLKGKGFAIAPDGVIYISFIMITSEEAVEYEKNAMSSALYVISGSLFIPIP